MNMRKYALIIIAMLFMACGGGENKNVKKGTVASNKTEKDLETKPEEGGYGFEDLADELGFETYAWSEEQDGTYFGDPRAKKGGMFNYIHSLFPRTMRIIGQNSSQVLNSMTISNLCYEGLLSQHPTTLEFIPSLASHWKISDDKMEFKFRIDPDARWWDGMPVTADDVIATWDLRMDETILSPFEQMTYGKFERPVAESKYIVSVKANAVNWRNFLYFSTMKLHPEHILKDLDGTAFLEEYAFSVVPGTGPYIIREENIKNQESYLLERREDYWSKDSPFKRYMNNFDKIKISAVKDNDALQFEKFKKGEQDVFNVNRSRRWIEETDFEATENGWMKKQRIFSEKPAGTSGYYFNMREWPFDDKRVRYAFCYLYDREKMNREMYYNEYGMMNSLYSGTVYENKNNNKFTYDPEKAVQLLTEAGYTSRNSDGWLVHEETGKVLSFTIITQKTSAYMITPVQQMLKEYGMDMQIQFIDYNTMIKNVNARNFNVCMLAYSGLIYPNPESSLRSTLADQDDNNNVWGFKSTRVDELLDEYDICFEQTRRIEIIQEIDGIFNEVHPIGFSIARNYSRLMWWDRFGYPDWMLSRYVGEYWDTLYYWWIDDEKAKTLDDAMENDKKLPIMPIDMKYWPQYLENMGS
jgi:microcin C transport system substrate-binding protein